jgi:hypothetical protein
MKHDQFHQRKWDDFTGELGQHPEFLEMPETTSTQKSPRDNGKPNEINSRFFGATLFWTAVILSVLDSPTDPA